MINRTGNKAHDDACSLAEGARQSAMVNATQDQVRTAEIAFYRACVASAKATGVPTSASAIQALRDLGTGGV